MKVLTLLRHAKAGVEPATMRDFDRPLAARGRRGAWLIGREMKRLALAFDTVLASPASRTVETVEEIEREFGPLGAEYDRRLYLADPHTLFEIVHEAPERSERLLLIGHNPGLEMLALSLARDDGSAPRRALAGKYPTGALAQIALDVERWPDVVSGCGTLERFIRPRDLDAELGPED